MHPASLRDVRVHTGEAKGRVMPRKAVLAITLLALAGTAPLLSGCYTTAGAGQDLQAAGHSLTKSAEKNTTYTPSTP